MELATESPRYCTADARQEHALLLIDAGEALFELECKAFRSRHIPPHEPDRQQEIHLQLSRRDGFRAARDWYKCHYEASAQDGTLTCLLVFNEILRSMMQVMLRSPTLSDGYSEGVLAFQHMYQLAYASALDYAERLKKDPDL